MFGQPTLINNVETWGQHSRDRARRGNWFKTVGTETSKGTKVFALAGNVVNTGLIEVPMGTTLREIIYDIGGGLPNGKRFKAVQTGGPSGGCLPEEYLDTPIDYDSLAKAGSIMGSGGMIVIGEDSCMVDIAKFFLEFTQNESCGKCTPCREGTKRMLEILTRITEGKGQEGDIEKLERLGNMIKKASLCGLGQSAPNPVLSTIKNFREEYEEHIHQGKCRASTCTSLLTTILPISASAAAPVAGFARWGPSPAVRRRCTLSIRKNASSAACASIPANLTPLRRFEDLTWITTRSR